MKLLKVYFDHLRMFKDGVFDFDLFSSDKVPASDESATELLRPVYTNNVIAFAGINASGKTIALNLLELACRIVNGAPLGIGASPAFASGLFSGSPCFKCLLWCDGGLYLVESMLAVEDSPDGMEGAGLGFSEEVVSRVPFQGLTKASLSSWGTLSDLSIPLYRRTKVGEAWAALASPAISIAAAVVAHETGSRRRVSVVRDSGFRLTEAFDGLDEVLRVFDSRIEHLDVRDSGRAFALTFAGEEPMLLSEDGLNEVLSSGTVRGVALVQRALLALRSGGYLLVDEIENHLNRQLVNVIVDLFTSRATNSKGATIVFTTHYPQLLDHIHRKDNVYFLVRVEAHGSEVVKYGNRVKRVENKKSEVFASNYVKGTSPRYTDVRALHDLVARAVSHE